MPSWLGQSTNWAPPSNGEFLVGFAHARFQSSLAPTRRQRETSEVQSVQHVAAAATCLTVRPLHITARGCYYPWDARLDGGLQHPTPPSSWQGAALRSSEACVLARGKSPQCRGTPGLEHAPADSERAFSVALGP